ncbi:MAG: carbohydrate ABC transporter permease [Planctomycetota bacterium]
MNVKRAARFSLAIALAVVFGYPLLWMVMTSFKSQAALEASAWAPPSSLYLGNFRDVLAAGHFGRYYLNSVLVCGVSVLAASLASAAAAYVFARMRFRGKEALFVVLLGGMMMPVHVTLIPLHRLMSAAGLLNTPVALIGPYVAFALPVSTFILRAFFEALPPDMEEAARIDGCSPIGAFWHVALPLAAPALATVFIFNFVHMWNEFAFALTLTSGASTTLPVGIYEVSTSSFSTNIPGVTAGLTIGVIPGLIVYFIAQRHIVKGMTAGALGG